MMFVYHYVIIPCHPQYLPRHAPLILQSGGIQGGGIRGPKPTHFLYSYVKAIIGVQICQSAIFIPKLQRFYFGPKIEEGISSINYFLENLSSIKSIPLSSKSDFSI